MSVVFTCQDIRQHTGFEPSEFHRCNFSSIFFPKNLLLSWYIHIIPGPLRLISKYSQLCAADVKNNDAYRCIKTWKFCCCFLPLYPTFSPLNIPGGSKNSAMHMESLLPSSFSLGYFHSQEDFRRGFVNFLSNCHHWISSMILEIKVTLGSVGLLIKVWLRQKGRERWERKSGKKEEVLK